MMTSQILDVPHPNYMIWIKCIDITLLQFPHLYTGNNYYQQPDKNK